MKNLVVGLLVSALIVSCGNTTKQKVNEEISETQELAVAQEVNTEKVKFPVYDFEGLEPLLHQDDDKVHVINFWATWCKPCVVELPYFEKIHAEQKENNVEVLLVSLDMPSMWKTRLEPFVKNKGLKSKVVILDDPKQNDWIPKVAEEWSGGIPATLIYNKDKRSFYEHGFTYEELNTELNKFLN